MRTSTKYPSFVDSAADGAVSTEAGKLDASTLDEAATLGLRLARELRRRWQCGERPLAEELFEQYAELLRRPDAAIDVIYEEYCLRQAAGEENVNREILRRFPQWREPLGVMLDCHRVLQPACAPSDFPSVGEVIGGFRLLDELARGARGRVYLAEQTDLAGRPVVLKITPLDGAEHLSLARLQHTNIVPVYSVEDDAARNVRILCMPYFGNLTLASLLESLAGLPMRSRSGKDVLAAIDHARARWRQPAPANAPAREMLAHVSYVQATCWIGAALADALHYAHEHRLVHLDVKPSNVLLATNGQPMLLDFHLSREPIPKGRLPDKLGGTPAYMPPEQTAAMRALCSGLPVERAVDAKADIYALGAILHEMLGGTVPRSAGRRPLSKCNPVVSVGLGDILGKCLAPGPEERYRSAAALADDLRRHLADRSLAGVPNRSVTERWRKWQRRKPSTLRAAGMLGVVVVCVASVLAGAWSHVRGRYQEAQRALDQGRRQIQRDPRSDLAVSTLQHGLSLVENLPLRGDLARQLQEQLAAARRLRARHHLHHIADQVRGLFGTDSQPPARLRRLGELSESFWEKRHEIIASLDAGRDSEVATDLLDMAVFWAELQVRLASEGEAPSARRQALRTLDAAQEMFGPSPVLQYRRHAYRTALGVSPSGDGQAFGDAEAVEPARRTAWQHYAIGRALLSDHHLASAAEELQAAQELDPSGVWPNFYYGLCAYRMGRHDDAVAAFSVCIGARPDLAGCFYNRALSYTALGRIDRASQDYARAVELDPTLARVVDTRQEVDEP